MGFILVLARIVRQHVTCRRAKDILKVEWISPTRNGASRRFSGETMVDIS